MILRFLSYKGYSLLRKLEKMRYWFIVLIVQIPLFLFIPYIIHLIYQAIKQGKFSDIMYRLQSSIINSPLIIKIWLGIVLLVMIFTKSNVFSFRSQYVTHIQNLLLIDFAEHQYISNKEGGS